jgi:hypothetical protein
MKFWKVTMRRSVKLSRTYFVLGIMFTIYGIVLSNLMTIIPTIIPPDVAAPSPIDLTSNFPFLSVALLSMSGVFFSLPVVMLFVYDKNSGVLEYLLSTGLDQIDIFKGYVKASLVLAAYLLSFAVILNTAVGAFLGTGLNLLMIIAILTVAIGVSEVFLVTVCMIAFSSLQKTPMGANQPVGVIIGIIPMFPALLLPIVFPSHAMTIDLSVAAITIVASLALLLSVGRLILREKLLP